MSREAKFLTTAQSGFLFSNGRLRDWLHQRLVGFTNDLRAISEVELLASPLDALSETLIEAHVVSCPIPHRDQISALPVKQVTSPDAQLYRSEDIRQNLTVRTFAVPFSGHHQVFSLLPDTHTANPPVAMIDSKTDELLISLYDTPGNVPDANAILRRLHESLDQVERWLEWSRLLIEPYDTEISGALALLSARKQEVLRERGTEAEIGFSVRRSGATNSFAAPLQRRRVALPKKIEQSVSTPEPVLTDSDFEAIMDVIVNTRNSLERSPSMAASFDEPQIRDLLLLGLNQQFDGVAVGEVFNGIGKTDILIRQGDRNVFIAECKIWHGQKGIKDALDQLLGYLVWRDTKAALLLFVRSGSMTEISAKAIFAIQSHPQFKNANRLGGVGERSDFVIRSLQDESREIHLSFLPFALPKESNAESHG